MYTRWLVSAGRAKRVKFIDDFFFRLLEIQIKQYDLLDAKSAVFFPFDLLFFSVVRQYTRGLVSFYVY